VNKYGVIYIPKLIQEFVKFPNEVLRNYILDVVFISFIKLKEHTLVWLESAFQSLPEVILTQNEKQDLLKSLNAIDVSILKLKNKDDDESKKLEKILAKFSKIFDLFEYR